MGYYIQTSKHFSKAEEIAQKYNGEIVQFAEAERAIDDPTKGVICVVRNPYFEAAGFCFNKKEFKRLAPPRDQRPRQWVIINRYLAEKLSEYDK